MKRFTQDIDGNWNWEKTKKIVDIKLPDNAEAIIFELQLGDDKVSDERLKLIVMMDKPNRYYIIHDFIDNKWLSKFARLSYGKSEKDVERNRVLRQLKILEPIFPRIILMPNANHTIRNWGLNLTAEQAMEGRTEFNKIYSPIQRANKNFLFLDSCEVPMRLKFPTKPSLLIYTIHPSRLGSLTTALTRSKEFYGAYGLIIGHIHENDRKEIESRLGKKLHIWFASHLFDEQPEYEKERMATFSPTKILVLGWKKDYFGKDVFEALY